MAGRTTALVIVGEHSVGPFRTREWKPRDGIALIEKHRPVWMPSPIGHSLGEEMPAHAIYLPWGLDPAEELLLVLAAVVVRDESVIDRVAALGGIREATDAHGASHRWLAFDDAALSEDLSWPTDLVPACAEAVRDRVRLGVVHLETSSLLDASQIRVLREWGLDMEEFASSHTCCPNDH